MSDHDLTTIVTTQPATWKEIENTDPNLQLLAPQPRSGAQRDPHTTFELSTPPPLAACPSHRIQAYPARQRDIQLSPKERSDIASHT